MIIKNYGMNITQNNKPSLIQPCREVKVQDIKYNDNKSI